MLAGVAQHHQVSDPIDAEGVLRCLGRQGDIRRARASKGHPLETPRRGYHIVFAHFQQDFPSVFGTTEAPHEYVEGRTQRSRAACRIDERPELESQCQFAGIVQSFMQLHGYVLQRTRRADRALQASRQPAVVHFGIGRTQQVENQVGFVVIDVFICQCEGSERIDQRTQQGIAAGAEEAQSADAGNHPQEIVETCFPRRICFLSLVNRRHKRQPAQLCVC